MKVDHTLASDMWLRFEYCRDRGHLDFLTKADKCEKFFAGLQWSEQDLQLLRGQKRPALTINKIISTLSTIMGEQIFNRSEVIFRPASGAPSGTAEALTKVWMQLAQNNQLNWVRSDVFSDGIIRSRGFYDARIEFTDSMRGEVAIRQLNSKNVLIDPDAEEYDPDSWGDVMYTKWMTPQDIEIMYGKEEADYLRNEAISSFPYGFDSIEMVRDRFDGKAYGQANGGLRDAEGVRRNIRVIERQYKVVTSQKHFVDVVTGDMRPVPDEWDRNKIASVLEKTNGTLGIIKRKVRRIKWTVTAGPVILHDSWSPYKHFTVVPYFPYFRYGSTIGVVENLLGPQELLNKVSSQELHVVNTTANSGWKIKAGSLVNMSVEELENYGAKTGLVLELDDVNNAEKISPNQTPTGLDRISYKAEEHIKSISNVSDSMQGFDREDVAAKAIQAKQQRGSVNFVKVMDNLERSDWILARNVLDMIQSYYTEERIINITHDDPLRESEMITVNEYDESTDSIVNDLTIGEFDIVITTTPYRATLEDSQFEQAVALRELGVPIPDSVLIENSRLMRKAEIVKAMNSANESPEAKAQRELELRGQQAEVAKTEAATTKTLADARLNNARADREEVTPIDTGGKSQQEIQQEHELALEELDREWAIQLREFALKREEMNRNFELKQQQQAADQALKTQESHARIVQDRLSKSRAADSAAEESRE